MIDLIIENAYKGLRHLKNAEWHLLEENVAIKEFNSASFYFNRLHDLDIKLYDRIIVLYDRCFDNYKELYHK